MAVLALAESDSRRCTKCGKDFHPIDGRNRSRYCPSCRDIVVSVRRAKAKREEGMRTGILYGKPISEVIFGRYKAGAKKRDLEFALSLEEFMAYWQKPCFYCGSPIETIGLDRKDSNLGYLTYNVTPCCTKCNLSKRNTSPEDYITHCKKVAQRF